MKVSVIGGGSTYTPELVSGFLQRIEEFPLTELWLMDVNEGRLQIVGDFIQRTVQSKGSPFKVVQCHNQQAAVSDASYIITQLRVGQMQARREDEYLGQRYGLVGQETTGVGGMAKALRTIPVILEIAGDVRNLSQPGALLVNFTNPAGLITQALQQYAPDVQSVGVCNVAVTAKMDIIEHLEQESGEQIDAERAELDTLGLNHLTWHRGFTMDGEDLWSRVLTIYLAEAQENPTQLWDPETIRVLGMLPNYYLKYFYYTNRVLEQQATWPPSRAEEVMDVENDLLSQYADPQLNNPPVDLMKRGGAYYSTVATQLLNAHFNDLNETHVVNIVNQGAVPEWPENWVLEMPARVNREGVHPISSEPLPIVCSGLITQVKDYELLTVQAAVHGDWDAAYQALLAHPLGPDADRVEVVLNDLLEVHRRYLPNFWEASN